MVNVALLQYRRESWRRTARAEDARSGPACIGHCLPGGMRIKRRRYHRIIQNRFMVNESIISLSRWFSCGSLAPNRIVRLFCFGLVGGLLFGGERAGAADLRLGIVGTDTSHAAAFTGLLNDPTAKDHLPGAKVVAAFKGGSPDIPISISRVETNAAGLRDRYGVTLCDTIEELCARVDGVLILSVDGRKHLPQARLVAAAGKPMFIDKPLGGTLGEALEIIRVAQAAGVPFFSSSSLRFAESTQAVRRGRLGRVTRAETTSPANREPTHPDLFWYGVHGCESLFTVMGTGCESVTRRLTADGKIEVVGQWKNGRTGIYREARGYGGKAVGEKGEATVGAYDRYAPLVAEIIKFFQTGKPPVPVAETIELFAFMEAADESQRQGGQPVTLTEVLAKAWAAGPPP